MAWFSLVRFLAFQMNGTLDEDWDDDYDFDVSSKEQAADPHQRDGAWILGSRGRYPGLPALETNDADLIYTAFDTSQPVEQPRDLRGRDEHIAKLVAGVLFRRNHGIVSGPRGSGKTSLVRSFGQFTDRDGVVVLYSSCDKDTSFGDLMGEYLAQIPDSSFDPEDVAPFRARTEALTSDATPNQVTGLLSLIRYSQVIIICDEFDRVTDEDLQGKLASIMKLLSDARVPVRIVLVGDPSAFDQIVRGHPSLSRHITRVSSDPLERQAIVELIDDCADRCNLSFADKAADVVEDVSCGSPYHARLFGMHGALRVHASGTGRIGIDDAVAGLRDAFDEWASLNTVPAARMLAIARGDFGAPEPFLRYARWMAYPDGKTQDSQAITLADGQLRALAPLLRDGPAPARFRDSIGPQFLIAICRINSEDSYRAQLR